jgi:large subunit ribosomal protein L13
MLPKNRLGRQMLKKLKVYSGADHPHKGVNAAELKV